MYVMTYIVLLGQAARRQARRIHVCGLLCVSAAGGRKPHRRAAFSRSTGGRGPGCRLAPLAPSGAVGWAGLRLQPNAIRCGDRSPSSGRSATTTGPTLPEPLEPLREVVGEDVGSSVVAIALSRHGRSAPRAQPWVLSYAGAGIPFLYHSYRGRSGSRSERLPRPFILCLLLLVPPTGLAH